MNPGFVWLNAVKDLRRQLRDPWSFVFWLGMPLLVGGLVVLAFGSGSGSTPTAKVVVVDHDDGFVSNALVQALGQAEVIQAQVKPAEEARKLLNDGRVTAMLTIPKDFGHAVLDQTPTTLELRTNPAQRILPGIVEEMLGILADAGFYVQQLFGDQIQTFSNGVPEGALSFPESDVAFASTTINAKMGRIAEYAFPPALDVKTTVDSTRTGPQQSFGSLFFSGILFMALLFMAGGVASDVWVEKEGGTLRRIVSSPQQLRDFLAGKIIAGAVLMTAVTFVALLIGLFGFGLRISAIPLALLWAVFSGSVFLIAITLIHLFASSARTAGVLSTMIIFPLLMIGGSFFPFELMPDWLQALGRLTPNGWALTQFKAILAGTAQPAALGTAFLGLFVVGGVAFFVAAHRLRRGFATG